MFILYQLISYKIKKLINDDRSILKSLNGDGKDPFNRIGKRSLIKHHVIPEQNNGEYHNHYE